MALPTAAAAALVLTATGATVTDDTPVALDLTGSQAAVIAEHDRRDDSYRITEQRQMQQQKQAGVALHRQQVDRAARTAARVAILQKRAAQARAEALTKARHQWVEPVKGCNLSSPFGTRWGRLHAGNDFACTMDTPIRAMSSGRVIFAGASGGYGNKVEIQFWDGTVSYFAHMDTITAKTGDAVMPGDLVGYSGNSGHSTGPHLHLEIHPGGAGPVDPRPWLESHHLFTALFARS